MWQRVVVNPSGRIVFMAMTLVALILLGLVGAGTTFVDDGQRWVPAIIAVLAGVAFVLLVLVSFSGMIYCLRFINVALLAMTGVGAAVFDGMLFHTAEDSQPPIFLVVCSSILVTYLFGMALLLVPNPHSDLAHRMHPYVAEADLGDITLTGHQHKRGRKRIKHREISIFEDWPAPVPFPAQALYSYKTNAESELTFHRGDQLVILDCRGNWWQARHPKTQMVGFVPNNYIQVLQKARVSKSFEAKDQDEVTVTEGQIIEIMEVHEFMCLVRSVDGKIGSVPTENLDVDPVNLSTLNIAPEPAHTPSGANRK
jgi:hypothetical protein